MASQPITQEIELANLTACNALQVEWDEDDIWRKAEAQMAVIFVHTVAKMGCCDACVKKVEKKSKLYLPPGYTPVKRPVATR